MMQEAMLRYVRRNPEAADSGIHTLLSTTLKTVEMGKCLNYPVALSLL